MEMGDRRGNGTDEVKSDGSSGQIKGPCPRPERTSSTVIFLLARGRNHLYFIIKCYRFRWFFVYPFLRTGFLSPPQIPQQQQRVQHTQKKKKNPPILRRHLLPWFIMPHSSLNHIAPYGQHLQPVQVPEVIFQIQLVEM